MTFVYPNPHGFSWQHAMIRVKDPNASVLFYEQHFGFRLVHRQDYSSMKVSHYYLAILPDGISMPTPGTEESIQFVTSNTGTFLMLLHEHGSEEDLSFKVSTGNEEPCRGFGHIAVSTANLHAACAELEASGVAFHKKLGEGTMTELAFASDPDGYWIEIMQRGVHSTVRSKFSFAQTMLRIKDPKPSLRFYRDLLGMTLLEETHRGDTSIYFLAHLTAREKEELTSSGSSDGAQLMGRRCWPVLELRYTHGTELDSAFRYYNGNDQVAEGQVPGFHDLGFLVQDLGAAVGYLESNNVVFKEKPSEHIRGVAVAYDPDRYWVEIVKRGASLAERS